MERPVNFFGCMRLSKRSLGGSWTKKQKLSATKLKTVPNGRREGKWKALLLLGI
jgi:hypothetical protein